MQQYILLRIMQGILSLWVISMLVFALTRFSGNPVDLMLDDYATKEDRRRLEEYLGINKPIPEQYLLFLGRALKGDLGKSITAKRPAFEMVKERVPNTLKLAITAFVVAVLIAIPMGVYTAYQRGRWFDFVGRTVAIGGQSVPGFWLGLVYIYLFAVILGWLPTGGTAHGWGWNEGIRFLILPSLTVGWLVCSGMLRLTRMAMLDALESDYVKLARVKGLPEWKVLWKHAFKNSLIPVVTLMFLLFAGMLNGLIIAETVFSWAGIGRMAIDSIRSRDYPVTQAIVLFSAALYVLANLAADVSYAYLNPKIRYKNR